MEFDAFHVLLKKISCGSNEALDPDVTKKKTKESVHFEKTRLEISILSLVD